MGHRKSKRYYYSHRSFESTAFWVNFLALNGPLMVFLYLFLRCPSGGLFILFLVFYMTELLTINIFGREYEFDPESLMFRYGFSLIFFRIFKKPISYNRITAVNLTVDYLDTYSVKDSNSVKDCWKYEVTIYLQDLNKSLTVFRNEAETNFSLNINESKEYALQTTEYLQTLNWHNMLKDFLQINTTPKKCINEAVRCEIISMFNENQKKRKIQIYYQLIQCTIWLLISHYLFYPIFFS